MFSVLHVSELIRGLTSARNLKKQLCMYMENIFLKTTLFIYFNLFPKIYSKVWVAKLGVRLICECSLYASVYGISLVLCLSHKCEPGFRNYSMKHFPRSQNCKVIQQNTLNKATPILKSSQYLTFLSCCTEVDDKQRIPTKSIRNLPR